MKKLLAPILTLLILFTPATAVLAQADNVDKICEGASLGDSEQCDAVIQAQEEAERLDLPRVEVISESQVDSEDTFLDLADIVINTLSLIVGVVSVIMIIIGGLRYITSSGDSGNVTNAKNTILYAVVGLIIVLFAQVMVEFIVARFN